MWQHEEKVGRLSITPIKSLGLACRACISATYCTSVPPGEPELSEGGSRKVRALCNSISVASQRHVAPAGGLEQAFVWSQTLAIPNCVFEEQIPSLN